MSVARTCQLLSPGLVPGHGDRPAETGLEGLGGACWTSSAAIPVMVWRSGTGMA